MTATPIDEPSPRKPLRLWPGVIAGVLLCVIRFVIPVVVPGAGIFGVLGGLACGLIIVIWWLFFSRVPWLERLGVIVLMAAALFATFYAVHVSIRTGMMGMMLPVYAIPALSLALVAGALMSQGRTRTFRRLSIVATILLACGFFMLLRTGGIMGNGAPQLAWRWSKTPEQRLLAHASDESAARGSTLIAKEMKAEWPGFRGAERDGVIRGVRIETDWSRSPPVQLWRRPVGPGWSSFAVRGDFLYTQEQRGDDEEVVCYKVSTGEPVWRHRDAVRFWESNAGAGPRATPTLSNGRIYSFGATGILNALDATNGAVLWSRNVASDADKKVPMWGFASSPLVMDDVVIVSAAGKLVAYDMGTGNPRWFGPVHGGSYSSAQRFQIGGVTQVVSLSGAGATSVSPTNGAVLWEYACEGVTIVQPAQIAGGDLLISPGGATGGAGMRRLAVAHRDSGWTVQERWTSTGLKPYFNDSVVHKGHAYGFDGSLLACIDLEDGKRKWKDGRYGNGEMVLLADQDVLLVLSEQGELALVGAMPDGYKELARSPAIAGKTWNHPVLVGGVLLVRNGEEMAAFRLALTGG